MVMDMVALLLPLLCAVTSLSSQPPPLLPLLLLAPAPSSPQSSFSPFSLLNSFFSSSPPWAKAPSPQTRKPKVRPFSFSFFSPTHTRHTPLPSLPSPSHTLPPLPPSPPLSPSPRRSSSDPTFPCLLEVLPSAPPSKQAVVPRDLPSVPLSHHPS